jgi:hypothetical protein
MEPLIAKNQEKKFQTAKADANYYSKELVITYMDAGYRFTLDSKRINGFDKLVFNPQAGKKFFSFKVKNETRYYPLPLEITVNRDVPELIVTAGINSYAMDSAQAEIGSRDSSHSEAVMALALLIKARAKMNKSPQRKNHQNFDFCDLTHCQVYTGKIHSNLEMDSHEIDISSLSFSPLFHSSCGGQTYGRGIFYLNGGNLHKIKDWLLGNKIYLCRDREIKWRRKISFNELRDILKPNKDTESAKSPPGEPDSLAYNVENLSIQLKYNDRIFEYAPETFRLRVNRKKGWNFIRSNNYTIQHEETLEGSVLHFTGFGLGHGVGLCQVGAMNLAKRGFSRYEILRHYFPQIIFIPAKTNLEALPLDLSFMIFSLRSGEIMKISYPAFSEYELSLGSISKIVVYLYLILYRQDLLKDYKYHCQGSDIYTGLGTPEKQAKNIKLDCWQKKGHGILSMDEALAKSCNLFFVSLSKFIDYQQYFQFFSGIMGKIGLQSHLWSFKSQEDKIKNFAGLDFKYRFRLSGLIKMVQFLSLKETADSNINELKQLFPGEKLEKLRHALQNTFISGTAYWKETDSIKKNKVSKEFMEQCSKEIMQSKKGRNENKLWGKTSTIIHGSNKLVSYGLFIGGDDKTGIITLLRGSNGHVAAQWAKCILNKRTKIQN